MIEFKMCAQAWKAYRNVFFRVNKILMRDTQKRTHREECVAEALISIVAYEKRRRPNRAVLPDWYLYKLGYEDVIYLFRNVYADTLYWYGMSRQEKNFVGNFITVLEYAQNEKLGDIDYDAVKDLLAKLYIIRRSAMSGVQVPRVPH